MSLDDCWEKVKEFQLIFGHPTRDSPAMLDVGRAEARSNWMAEEIREFIESETVYEQADAMIDLIYFAVGTLVELGVRPGPLFDAVHAANMRKLGPDKRPCFASDGKTIKPAGWYGPDDDIKREIDAQRKVEVDGAHL